MNCIDFTSSNGNRNGKRNQGAANCGARAEQHYNSCDFFERPVPIPQTCSSERGSVHELAPMLCGFERTPGYGTDVRTRAVRTQCFRLSPTKTENASAA